MILCRFLLRNELPSISRSEFTAESFVTSECSETSGDSDDCERGGDSDESEWKESDEEEEEKEPGLVRNDSQIGNTLERFTNEVEEWEEERDGGNDDTDDDEDGDDEGERKWEEWEREGEREEERDLVTLMRAAYFDAQKDSWIFEGNWHEHPSHDLIIHVNE